MRRLLFPFAALLVLLLLGSDSSSVYDDRTEFAGIEGTWQMTECEQNGTRMPNKQKIVLTIRRGTYTVDSGDGNPWKGSFHNDPSRTPPYLDVVYANGPFKGQKLKFIYQLKDDTLRIACTVHNDDLRPQAFNDKNVFVGIYKPVK